MGIRSLTPCGHAHNNDDDDNDSGIESEYDEKERTKRCSAYLPDEAQHEVSDKGPICSWDELPPWMKDNPAIVSGYRRPTHSYSKAIVSLGYLHNESGR